jgi:hypothetical protein
MFCRLRDSLVAQGIDPASRSHLIEDFAYTEARLTALRLEYQSAKGKARMAVVRALNVAGAERRRLHTSIFSSAKTIPGKNLYPEDDREQNQIGLTAAKEVWRKHFRSLTGKIATVEEVVKDPEGKKLEQKFGPPSWSVLIDP